MWINNGPALWLDAKQQEVVPDGDPRASFLLVAAGGQLPEDEARKWGLLKDETGQAYKAMPAPENKIKPAPVNKRTLPPTPGTDQAPPIIEPPNDDLQGKG